MQRESGLTNLCVIVWLALILILPFKIIGQDDFIWSADIDTAHSLLFHLDYHALDIRLGTLPEDNGYSLYLKGAVAFAREMSDGSRETFEKGLQKRVFNIELLESLDSQSPYKRFLLAELYLYEMLLHLKYGKNWDAGRYASKARKHLERNIKSNPDFHLSYKTLGLLELSLSAAPVSAFSKWMASISTGIDNNQSKGMEHLLKAKEWCKLNDSPFLDHCLLTELYLHLQIIPDFERAYQLTEQFSFKSSDNPLWLYLAAYTGSKRRDCETILALAEETIFGSDDFPVITASYLIGKCQLIPLEDCCDEEAMQKFLDSTKNEAFKTDAQWRIAIYRLIQGDQEGYDQYRSEILIKDKPLLGVDAFAYWEATNRSEPNADLMAVRMLWDAGYDEYAKARIQRMELPSNSVDILEYHYRMGKIYAAEGETVNAIEAYRRASLISDSRDPYYRCNALLQLGILHELIEDDEFAYKFYKQALNVNPPVYGSSIHRKQKRAWKD